jgi:hypothetical protein
VERTLLVALLLPSNKWTGNTGGIEKVCGEPGERVTRSSYRSSTGQQLLDFALITWRYLRESPTTAVQDLPNQGGKTPQGDAR